MKRITPKSVDQINEDAKEILCELNVLGLATE